MINIHRVFNSVLVNIESETPFVNAHGGCSVGINHDGGFAVGMRDLLLWDECLLEGVSKGFVGKPFPGVVWRCQRCSHDDG